MQQLPARVRQPKPRVQPKRGSPRKQKGLVAGESGRGPWRRLRAGRSVSFGTIHITYHAFGLIGTTFRELEWKTLIFAERAVPITPNAIVERPAGQ